VAGGPRPRRMTSGRVATSSGATKKVKVAEGRGRGAWVKRLGTPAVVVDWGRKEEEEASQGGQEESAIPGRERGR
jgi:hypothetical protein